MRIKSVKGAALALVLAALVGGTVLADSATVPELDTTLNDYFWTTTNRVNSTCHYTALSGVVVTGGVSGTAMSAPVGSAVAPFEAIAMTCADGTLYKDFSTLPVGILINFR